MRRSHGRVGAAWAGGRGCPACATALAAVVAAAAWCPAADAPAPATRPAAARAGDWPMWGGRPDRNMVSEETGLAATWDVAARRNVKWVAPLGSRTFGNPVVAGGRVFIGTNNEPPRNPRVDGDKGVLACFAEADGRFLWQAVHDKLPDAEKRDWPEIGVCSTPCVVGDRVYYVSNRGELVCLDAAGFHDGRNDGPIEDEPFHDKTDADFVWILDMVGDLGVVPHNASASPPLVVDDLVFAVTGNGIDADHEKVPAPNAPSFVAVDRHSGKVVWRDSSPGAGILDGQWSGPAYGVVRGRAQVVFPGGDGWLYSFEPKTGRLIWKFNCNAPPAGGRAEDDAPRNQLVATPVIHQDRVYIAVGQDPEAGDGPGCLWAVDATKTGDVTGTAAVWRYGGDDFGRSISTVAVRDGLLYAAELRGYLHCVDAASGRRLWRHDLKCPVWSSPMVADGKVYIGNEDGDVRVFAHGRQERLLATNAMKETVYSTVVAANGTLYVADRLHLYAIASAPAAPAAVATAPAGRDWPQFRGNPSLTGVAGTELPPPLSVRWRFTAADSVESSAAIVGDAAYVGCNGGQLYALSLKNGAVRWAFKAGAAIKSSPCVAGGLVLFGDGDGVFHAVGTEDGRERWSHRTGDEIISSATCAGDRVLFGSYDNHLYCLRRDDGALLWKFETEGRVHGTPGIAGEFALVAGCDEKLRIVHLRDGTAAGAVGMGGYSGASAAVLGPRVFVGTFANQVLAVDWQGGRVDWTYEPPDRPSPFYASAAVTEDVVVIGGRDKRVHALDPRTGRRRWTLDTQGRVDGSAVISGGTVYVGSEDGVLYGIELSTGRPVWRFEAGSAITASPAAGQGRLVIGSEDGTVYCFAPQGAD